MAEQITMDVDELNKALDILKNIPTLLGGGEGSFPPVSDLQNLAKIEDINRALQGFAAHGGDAQSAVSGWINARNAAIQSEITKLQSACNQLAQKLAASMNSYTGTDKYNADDVRSSGPTDDGSSGTKA